jgi:CRISPR/Cas system endoribonuclease Cas6 (RAMP superfamily)
VSRSDTSELGNVGHADGQQLRRIELTLRSDDTFPVPYSDGYSVYGALLSVLDEVNPDVSAHVHDSPLGSLHSSGLVGSFGGSDRAHHKTVRAGEPYELTLGVVDPADAEIFQALVTGLVLEGDALELSHGTLRVETFESTNATHAELLDRAGGADDPTVELTFRTPTCIEEAGEVTTMFPHRWAVFRSLLGKWNASCPEELALELDREAVLSQVIEKPDARTYETHSVLVSRGTRDDGENRNIFRQGFTGTCGYAFKGASEAVQNAVLALAVFGEYSGVGSAVARGCGSIEVIGE